MKQILFFALWFALLETTLAQGLGVFPPGPGQDINFVAIANAPLDNLPAGTVSYFPLIAPGEAPTTVLYVYVDAGSVSNTDGWILQKGNDGSLTPIMQLTIEPDYSGSIGTYLGLLPSSYIDFTSMQLTAAQFQDFLEGQLYAQVDFGGGSYLGQLLPVPEPSSIQLIFCGAGFLALLLRKKSFVIFSAIGAGTKCVAGHFIFLFVFPIQLHLGGVKRVAGQKPFVRPENRFCKNDLYYDVVVEISTAPF